MFCPECQTETRKFGKNRNGSQRVRCDECKKTFTDAFKAGAKQYPDGSIISRVAWALVASEENNKAFGQQQSFVAGPPKNGVQLLVKDSQKYAATGGWGFFQFDDGKLPTATKISKCYICHTAVQDRDHVFSSYARRMSPCWC